MKIQLLALLCTSVLVMCLMTVCQAQQARRQQLDSLYNDPFFYPTVSAVLLPKGFTEINNVSALLTANQLFSDQAHSEELNARASTFSNLLQVTYGVSAKSRLNVGVDLLYNAFRLDLNPDSSPWKVFSRDSALSDTRGLSIVGLRFRLKPLVHNRRLVLQGVLYQPVRQIASSQTNVRFQAIYVLDLARNFFLYTQAGLAYTFPKRPLSSSVSLPVAAIFQYQIRPTVGVLGLIGNDLTIRLAENGMGGQTAFGTQLGAGAQYQPSLQFGLTGFYTRYLIGRNSAVYNTMNVAIRLII